jgi:hypothetical protein
MLLNFLFSSFSKSLFQIRSHRKYTPSKFFYGLELTVNDEGLGFETQFLNFFWGTWAAKRARRGSAGLKLHHALRNSARASVLCVLCRQENKYDIREAYNDTRGHVKSNRIVPLKGSRFGMGERWKLIPLHTHACVLYWGSDHVSLMTL